jgi:hypothetical protein
MTRGLPQPRHGAGPALVLPPAPTSQSLVVVTSCSDEVVHRRRVEARSRGIPGWHELDWEHVADVLAHWAPPGHVDLRLDAVSPLDANAAQLAELLGRP